jgi:zinc protease
MSAVREHRQPAPATAAAELPALPADVQLATLENGLVIIVREDHSAPVVSAQAWCRAGSINEGRWLGAGLSHVLEHMLFKGTSTRAGSRIDQEVQEAGGYMNAYTSFDRTVYWINVPNTGARTALAILADIMQNATLPADELAKELDVIRREMDMGQDDPVRRSGRRLFETAYTRSPYRYTIIGYPDIFNQLTREAIFAYYQEKYAPNNTFFVVVGDVRADEIFAQLREAYEHKKARALPPEVLPAEPPQTAPREVIEEAAVELGHLHLAWHTTDLRHPDLPALEVLATLLGGGRSSRLFREVRERRGLAHSVDAWTYNPGLAGLFGASAMVDADRFTAAREAMLDEVRRAQEELIPADELQKAVKQLTAGTLAARKTMQGQAQDLGANWLAAHDLNFSARHLAAIQRVTAPDLQRVARAYLTAENRTCYALLPTGTTPRTVVSVAHLAEQPVQKFDLPNGLRLLVKEDHRLPFVEFRALFKGGVLGESATNNGATHLMAKLLIKGTSTRDAGQIASAIESVGGSIDSYAGNNSFGVTAEVMREDFELGLNLVADVLHHPAFPLGELERERGIQIAGIRSQRDQMLQSAFRAMRRALFGQRGYGLDALGDETTVSALTREALLDVFQRFAAPRNSVLAIYGDVDTAHVRTVVSQTFGSWQGGAAFEPPRPDSPPAGQKRVTETRDKKQGVLVMGFPGASLFDPDRYALELLQEGCSDLGSRLFLRIREKLGLAYYVGAQNFLGLTPGYFAFYVGTTPEKLELVEQELQAEASLLRGDGLTADELARAKAKVVGQRKIARQDLGGLATTNALDELYGLGYDHADREDARYEAVTREQVRAAAQKYLRPEAMVVATVRPE